MCSIKNGNYKRSTQKFPCSYCDKVFTRHGGLVGHLRVHTGERPHQCQMCGKRFSDSSSLTKHIRTHTGEKPFLCNICHRAFSISHNLTRHLKLHAKQCQNVGSKVQFPGSGSSKAKRSYICSKCNVICQSFTELNNHMQKMHARQHAPKTSTILPTKTRIEKPNSLEKSANTVFLDLPLLSKIIETDSFIIPSLEPKEMCLQDDLKTTIELSDEDPHLPAKENLFHLMPNNDNLQFLTHSVLDNVDIDQNKLAVPSLVKNNSLNQSQNLLPKVTQEKTSSEIISTHLSPSSNSTSHLYPLDPLLRDPLTDVVSIQQNQETSLLQNQFKSVCPNNKTDWTLKTNNNGQISQHKKSRQEFRKETHSLKKDKISHNTNTVSIENLQKTAYINREHQWQHRTLGILPEPKTPSPNIKKQTIHNRSFRGQNSSGPTPGQEKTKSQLKPRSKPARLGHKTYPCLYCDKVFTRPGGLVGHTRVHTGEKPHKCLTCGKRFSDSSSLTKHIRTHTGEKPFQCKLCHRAFSISHNLTRHLKLHSRDKLHSREGNHYSKPTGAFAKAINRIHSNLKPIERRINKYRSSSTLRKPSLGQTSSEIPAANVFDAIKDIRRYPSLVNGRESSKEESVLLENDIKPTNLSSLQIKELSSKAVDQENLVLTWCPSEEHNNFKRSNEHFEVTNSILSLVASSEYDSIKNFEEKHEPNETLKNGSILNSLDITSSANSSSSAVASVFSVSNLEPESKMDPSWFDICGSAEDERIGSERISPLFNNQCEQFASSSEKDVNIDCCDNLYTERSVKKDILLPSFEENKLQTLQNATKPIKTSQMYQCGYCLGQFNDMKLLSEHIQVHNKKSQLPQNSRENQTICFQNDPNFSEPFRQTEKVSIDFKLEDKNIQNYSKSNEKKRNALTTKPQNTFHTETQQTKTTNTTKLSSHLSVPTKNLNSSPLQNGEAQILQAETLVDETKSKFHCPYCDKVFSRHSGLIGHLRVHTGEKPYECQTCNKRFSDSSSLTKHIRIHTGEKPFVCTICNRAFSISHNLTRHLKLHSREKQQNVNANKPANLFKLGKSGARSIRCRYCCATFQSLKVLKSHLRYHSLTSKTFKTGRKNPVGNGKRINDATNPTGDKREIFNPDLPFQMNTLLPNHSNKKKQFPLGIKIHNKILKNRRHSFGMTNTNHLGRKYIDRVTNSKSFVKDTLSSTLTSSTGMTFESPEEMKTNEMVSGSLGATKESSDASTLSQNNAIVPSTEFLPKFTEKGFLTFKKDDGGTNLVAQSAEIKQTNGELELRNLLKSCPTDNERNLTTNSDLSLPNQEDLKDLLMERKPFLSVDINETEQFENDSKKFCSNYSRNHSRETESNPKTSASTISKCGYCHQSFRDFSSLSKHMSVHRKQQSGHQNSSKINSDVISLLHSRSLNERLKMQRLISGVGKSWISLNKKDVRIYPCPFCAKQFTRHGGLVGHLRVHTGEKPYECQTCSKRFSDSSSLTKHIRTHTGEKPFRCKLCHRAFSISHNLTRHLKLHSRENQKSNTQNQHIKRKGEKYNQGSSNHRFAKNKVLSFGMSLKSNGFHLSSANSKSNYCKKTSRELQDIHQSYPDKNSASDCQIENLTSSESESTLASHDKFNVHQQNINPENISSHLSLFSQSVPGMTTDHLSVIPAPSHSLSNNNVSSNQLLEDQEISLKFKPQFLSSPPKESNVPNKTSQFLDNAQLSDSVSPILQPVINNHLSPVSKETPSFSSNSKAETDHLISYNNSNDVKSCNKQSSQISLTKNESDNESKTFSDTFSKTFLLLESLYNSNSTEMNNLQLKTKPQTLHTENLHPLPNAENPNPNTRIQSPFALSIESNMNKNTSESFLNPTESLRISSSKENDNFSVETVLNEVTESLNGEQDYSLSVDKKVFNSLYTFQNGQTFNNTAESHIQSNNQSATTPLSFQDPHQKTRIPKSTCILCRTDFPNFKQLEAHLRIHRIQNRTFACGYCGRNFTRFSGLMGHARTHTLERPYVCNICQRAFSDSSSLTKHTRTHTGEKPFTCKYCSRAFSISHNLTRHLKLHSREKKKPP